MKKIYIIAGEPSGDMLGAEIVARLKQINGLEIIGIGGELMKNAGITSLIDIKEISVGGLFEVLRHIKRINNLINHTVEDILRRKPDLLFTIDSPGFCFRVAKLVRKKDPHIKLVHFVAPSVWAWRPRRAKNISKIYDHLLTLFDFEPKYFEKYGLATTFVGHPAIEQYNFGADERKDLLLLMPGSRAQEIKTLLPIFIESLKYLNFQTVVIPTISSLKPLVEKFVGGREIKIISDEEQKKALFQEARCAVVASGTATLQLALSGCPMVVCYKLNSLSFHIIKFLAKVKFISLVNIIMNRSIVPELIQLDCTPKTIADIINSLNYSNQIKSFKLLKNKLQNGVYKPLDNIIATIFALLN